ncbi:PilN family type IVB pilus formation outer membrane protein [Achromobacter aloeverae]
MATSNRLPLVFSALGLLLSLAACSSFQRINDAPNNAAKTFHDSQNKADEQRDRNRGAIQTVDHPWLSTTPVSRYASTAKLPADRNCTLQFIADAPMSLSDFAQLVSQDCHVPVRITPDAWDALAGATASSATTDTSGGAMPPMSSISGGPLPPGGALAGKPSQAGRGHRSSRATSGALQVQPIRWLGRPLAGLLDVVTSQLGISWSYRDGAVVLHYLDTRTYKIALSSELDFSSSITSGASLTDSSSGSGVSSSGSSSTTKGDSTQKTSQQFKATFDGDLKKAIESMLTPDLGRYAISPSVGTLTVTDTPDVLDKVAQFLDETNSTTDRQAELFVTVAMVTLNDSDSLGINWNAVWNSLNGNYGLTLANSFSPLTGSSSAGFGILDSATGRAGQFKGTNAVLSALSQQGTVSIYKQRGVTTQNRQPTPIQMTKEQQYVCGRSQTNTAEVGATESIQMCSVVTGFAMDMLPDIKPNNRLTLLFNLNMSPPATITLVPGDPTKPIYTAEVDRQVFQQRVGLKSGQTLVLSDFQEGSEQSSKQGLGDLSAWVATGGGTRDSSKRVVVIIITPEIMPDAIAASGD